MSFFGLRVLKVKKSERTKVLIDLYSHDFYKDLSIDISSVFEDKINDLVRFWPGTTKFEWFVRGSDVFLFVHYNEDGQYKSYFQKTNLKTLQISKRVNLISSDLNGKEKTIQSEIKVSENGEYFSLMVLSKEEDYMTRNSIVRVYDKEGGLMYSRERGEDIIAYSSQRMFISNEGRVLFLGRNKNLTLGKESSNIESQGSDSLALGHFYYRYPNRWLVQEKSLLTQINSENEIEGFAYSYEGADSVRAIVSFIYSLDSNKFVSFRTSNNAPNKSRIALEKIIKDESGNTYVFGERKSIVNSLFVNNKNGVFSEWFLGFIYVSKFDENGVLLWTKSIQRKYTGTRYDVEFLAAVKDDIAYVFYKDTKGGLKREKDNDIQVIGSPSSAQTSILCVGIIDAFGRVQRKEVFPLDFDTQKSYFNGLMLSRRYIDVGNAIIYISDISTLKLGAYKISRLTPP